MKTKAIDIGNMTFAQFIGRRLEKDGIGFIPDPTWSNGCTDRKTYIRSPLPVTNYDFLVYAHELGHCKGKQVVDPSSDLKSAAFWPWGISKEKLLNEFLAWDWAFRFMHRMNIFVEKQKIEECLKATLGTYIRDVSDDVVDYADKLVDNYSKKWGFAIDKKQRASINVDTAKFRQSLKGDIVIYYNGTKFTIAGFDEAKLPKQPVKKSPKWKPWHDIQESKAKKFWKDKHSY